MLTIVGNCPEFDGDKVRIYESESIYTSIIIKMMIIRVIRVIIKVMIIIVIKTKLDVFATIGSGGRQVCG